MMTRYTVHTHTHRVWPAGTVQTTVEGKAYTVRYAPRCRSSLSYRVHSSVMKFVNIVFSPRGRRATRRRLRADSDWRPARFSHRMGPPRRAGRMWRDAARRTASRARLARAHTYADRNTSLRYMSYMPLKLSSVRRSTSRSSTTVRQLARRVVARLSSFPHARTHRLPLGTWSKAHHTYSSAGIDARGRPSQHAA